MIPLHIQGNFPEGILFTYGEGRRKQYLANHDTIELAAEETETVLLTEEGPKTGLQKLLIGFGIFLTAPIQLAYLVYGGDFWEEVIPYHTVISLTPKKGGSCTLTYSKPVSPHTRPDISLSDRQAAAMDLTVRPAPWKYDELLFRTLARVHSAAAWLLSLMLYLFVVSFRQGNLPMCVFLPIIILGILLCCAFSARHHSDIARKCKAWMSDG